MVSYSNHTVPGQASQIQEAGYKYLVYILLPLADISLLEPADEEKWL